MIDSFKRWSIFLCRILGLKSPQLHCFNLHPWCCSASLCRCENQEFCWAQLWNYHGLRVVNWMLHQRWMTSSWRTASCERWVAWIWCLKFEDVSKRFSQLVFFLHTYRYQKCIYFYSRYFDCTWFWLVYLIFVHQNLLLLEHFWRCISGCPASYYMC